MINKDFELLAPAGSFETFKAVIEAGADAIYVGGSQFGARAYANNFDKEELLCAIDYAHIRGRQVYLTVNTLLKNQELENELYDYLLPFYERGLDAVLVQDFGTLKYIHERFSDLPIHTSTQMTVTGVEGAKFLKKFGVTRVVMAREVSLAEMKKIHEEADIEIEAFVHGALCYCYSGQCLFSSILGGRSGNRGRCAQPCRLAYSVLDQEKNKVLDDTYILSLKDMCGLKMLPELKKAGVYSLKIEGRMKQSEYAAGVVSLYRKYIDIAGEKKYKNFSVTNRDYQAIFDLGNRCGFTNTYYSKHNDSDMVTYVKPNYSTGNEAFHNKIKESYIGKSSKLAISGEVFLYNSAPSIFVVHYGDLVVEAEGMEVSDARNKPLTNEDVKNRMCKTGDTPFKFLELTVNMDDGIFVPNGALNQLKREVLGKLEQELLKEFRRDKNNTKEITKANMLDSTLEKMEYSCSVETKEQFLEVIKYDFINKIYFEWNMIKKSEFLLELSEYVASTKSTGKEAYLILPTICRKRTMDFILSIIDELKNSGITGIVVKNNEELWLAQNYFSEFKIVSDHNMYAYNDYAIDFLHENGVDISTVPLELNKHEISHRNNSWSEMIIYGYYPLMTSAQCVHKNSQKCNKVPGVMYLKDRYNKKFLVKNNCSECYNVIYNSLPVALFKNVNELYCAGINNFRLSFTIENSKQVSKVMKVMKSTINGDLNQTHLNMIGEYTNGHYKRGVE